MTLLDDAKRLLELETKATPVYRYPFPGTLSAWASAQLTTFDKFAVMAEFTKTKDAEFFASAKHSLRPILEKFIEACEWLGKRCECEYVGRNCDYCMLRESLEGK